MVEKSQERRSFPRYEVACPIKVFDATGQMLAETQTVNISQGGAFLLVPTECAPEPESHIEIGLSVPAAGGRDEQFAGRAIVVRQEQEHGADQVGIAIKFATLLPFELEGLVAGARQGV